MKKYDVTFPVVVHVKVRGVEAEDSHQAVDAAYEEALVSYFAGNGGTEELIGVSGENAIIDSVSEPICDEISIDFSVEVKEV